MHDIKWIRDNRQAFDAALMKRDEAFEGTAARVLELDEQRRTRLQALQDAQARRNAASKEIGKAKGSGDEARARTLIDEVAKLKDFIQQGEEKERALDRELHDFLATIPNLPLDDVPVGADESANVVVHEWGRRPEIDFAPRQHFEIGEALGLMDFETAARLSGARFVVLKGALARLERALASFMLDLHTTEFGYTEVLPPALVRDEALFGTGQLPKFAEDLFAAITTALTDDARAALAQEQARLRQRDQAAIGQYEAAGKLMEMVKEALHCSEVTHERKEVLLKFLDDFWLEGLKAEMAVAGLKRVEVRVDAILDQARWLVPTAEVPLTNLVREQILAESDLPMRVTAWTPCFRAEAGAAGKDTRGMIRQHQFSKVELVSITTPEDSLAELERMTSCAEEVLKRLDLPYRVVTLCTGDMGFAAQKTYDIEVWLPGQGTYREISSCSVCGDFQARRMNARYRPQGERSPRFVHTLNGSGLAVGRTMIAILENCQQADGSVTIPDALRPYMGGLERISA